MKLYSLIKGLNCRVFGNVGVNITGLYHNDVQVKEGGLFFCLRGTKVDGVDYVKSAARNGAVAIVVEQEIPFIFGVTQIIVKNAREMMSLMACKFYGNPAKKLKLVGVTGTNGKTTTATILAEILKFCGHKTALIGTNGVVIEDKRYDSGMTTPDPIELQKYFSLMVRKRVECVCMEVSAHAIDLFKIAGLKFEIGIFTNLTEDHLDYFKTMEKYFECKLKFFLSKYVKQAVINIDDEYGERICSSIKTPKQTYAIVKSADFVAENIETKDGKQYFNISNKNITVNLLGRFNLYNILAAFVAAKSLNEDEDKIIEAFKHVGAVDGRFNIYEVSGRCFIVDYAHTPDGLKNILNASREIAKDGKLICVFGCGGNRETQKRAKMGEIAIKNTDFSVITSDNPRFESKKQIINDIKKDIVNSNNYITIEDRKEAIKKAFEISNVGDIIVVAGKGAEKYIDEMGVKTPYSDVEEILKLGEINE